MPVALRDERSSEGFFEAPYYGELPLELMSCDMDLLRDRQSAVAELAGSARLFGAFSDIYRRLAGLKAYVTESGSGTQSAGRLLLSMVDAQKFTACADALAPEAAELLKTVKTEGLRGFLARLAALPESETYDSFKNGLEAYARRVQSPKSITLGVNLDSMLRAKEIGLVSINNQSFKSGKLIDKLMRFEFKKDDYDCLAPMAVSDTLEGRRSVALAQAILATVNDCFEDFLKEDLMQLRRSAGEAAAELLDSMPELRLLLDGARFYNLQTAENQPVCLPELADGGKTEVRGFAVWKDGRRADGSADSDRPIMWNNSDSDRAVLQATILAQLGLPVPAASARVAVKPAIIRTVAPEVEDRPSADLEFVVKTEI